MPIFEGKRGKSIGIQGKKSTASGAKERERTEKKLTSTFSGQRGETQTARERGGKLEEGKKALVKRREGCIVACVGKKECKEKKAILRDGEVYIITKGRFLEL